MSEKFSNNPFAEPLKNFKPEKKLQQENVIANTDSSKNIIVISKDLDAILHKETVNEEELKKIQDILKKLRYATAQEKKNSKHEHIPNAEEVRSLFEKILGGVKYETRRQLEDEQGLYLWEIKIPQEDGTSIEYEYCRKGDYKSRGLAGGSASETAIHVTFFDEDEIPESGHSVLKLIDNKWIETV